jgi:hypothetical protein
MAAAQQQSEDIHFELFTTCRSWIFEDTLTRPFGYHEVRTDVGVVQLSPLEEDVEATLLALNRFMPFDPEMVSDLVVRVKRLGCRAIVCDISPLGIAVAKGAGLPCVLIENFTWDFIYEPYMLTVPELEPHVHYLRTIFSQADYHIQTAPMCRTSDRAMPVPPISRKPRTAPGQIRKLLNIPDGAKMVLVSMGGVPDKFRFLQRLSDKLDAYLVIPGANGAASDNDKVIPLPAHSRFFHPDLLQAVDLLLGKAGYSTIAEAYHSGTPFAYVPRPKSPESPALERFIADHLPSRAVSAKAYDEGRWIDRLPDLLRMQPAAPSAENGADVVARWLIETF